jgi:hypothetical protein
VAQQILSIFKADSGGTQAMTERVPQIMHPHLRQTSPVSRFFPSVIPDAVQSLATVCEDNAGVLAPLPCNDFPCDPIENHYSFLSILCN